MCVNCGQTNDDGEQTGLMLQAGRSIRGTKLLAAFALLIITLQDGFVRFSSFITVRLSTDNFSTDSHCVSGSNVLMIVVVLPRRDQERTAATYILKIVSMPSVGGQLIIYDAHLATARE